jgi:hypothetical protein
MCLCWQARKGLIGGAVVAAVAIGTFVLMLRSSGRGHGKRGRRRREEPVRG